MRDFALPKEKRPKRKPSVIDLEELKQMAGLMGQATNELPKVPQRD